MGGLPKIPPYTIYKVGNVPQLGLVQKRLKAVGLRDPWLRNECWRFHPGFGTLGSRFATFWTKGVFVGVCLGYITYLANMEYLKRNPDFYRWEDPQCPENHHKAWHSHGGGGHH